MYVNNSTQPNFKSLYIIKGTAKNVDKASTLIRKTCNNAYVHDILAFEMGMAGMEYTPPKKVLKNFTDCDYCYLTQVYSATQPLVQNLIATNEHVDIVKNYLLKDIKESDYKEETAEGFDEGDLKIMILDKLEDEADAIEAYEFAEEKCKQGDSGPLTKFIVESQIKAKECLNKILEPHGISTEHIRTINALDVINAITNRQFDPIKGIFAQEKGCN